MAVFARALRLAAAAALSLPLAHVQTPPQRVIVGDVVDSSTGQGIAGARVSIQSGQDDPLFVTADAQGHFRFDGLENKTYQAAAAYPGFMFMAPAAVAALNARNPIAQIRLEMLHYGVIAGRVTDPVGVPIAGIPVAVFQRYPKSEPGHTNGGIIDGDYRYLGGVYATTNDLGEYRAGWLRPGSYYIAAQTRSATNGAIVPPPPEPTERDTYYPHALKLSEATPVEVAAGKEVRADIQLARASGLKVSGRVLGVGTGAAPGAHLSVDATPLSPGLSGWSSELTDGDRFEATGLMPGSYRFVARQNTLGSFTAAALRIVEVGTQDLDGIDLTLEPTTDIQGSVVFESGCPAGPLLIGIGSDTWWSSDVHPDAGGAFVLQHVVPGKYKVYARTQVPSSAFAGSVKLGGAEASTDGFEVTSNTTGPLVVTMSCGRK